MLYLLVLPYHFFTTFDTFPFPPFTLLRARGRGLTPLCFTVVPRSTHKCVCTRERSRSRLVLVLFVCVCDKEGWEESRNRSIALGFLYERLLFQHVCMKGLRRRRENHAPPPPPFVSLVRYRKTQARRNL